jgi:DNA-binding LacI/PurR family transcriptional regulator
MNFQKTTLKDVARALGVSEQTVSNVINGKPVVKDDTRQRVLEACERMGYRANVLARSLKTSQSSLIALVMPSITNSKYPEIAQTVTMVAAQRGFSIIVAVSDRSAAREAELVNQMLDHQVAGILLSTADNAGVAQQAAGRFGVPCIEIMNRGPRAAQDFVGADNRAGARLAIDHLIELGHRRIGHIRGLPIFTGNERAEGYAEALVAHGIPVDPDLTESGDYSREGASAAIKKLLARAPDLTAVFCSSDLMAYGVLDAVGSLGQRVPETLSVVGFDDMAFSSLGPIGLTSIAYDSFNLATLAVRRLTDCIADRSVMAVTYEEILPCSLVVRGSAKQIGAAA